jgi:hypothetical protein
MANVKQVASRYTLDTDVLRIWEERCTAYRRKTGWLRYVVYPAILVPIGAGFLYGARAFLPSMAIAAAGLLVVGVVLSAHTSLLFCPKCGRRPVSLGRRYPVPLYARVCDHCFYWLKRPDHLPEAAVDA